MHRDISNVDVLHVQRRKADCIDCKISVGAATPHGGNALGPHFARNTLRATSTDQLNRVRHWSANMIAVHGTLHRAGAAVESVAAGE